MQTERIFMLDDLDFILDFNNFIYIELYKYFTSIMPSILTRLTNCHVEWVTQGFYPQMYS